MGKLLSRFWGVCLLLGGIGVGMLIQAKIQCLALDEAIQEVSLVRALARSSSDCAAALNRTTAERNRLLEHLADLETNVDPATCSRVTVWACPVQEGGQ